MSAIYNLLEKAFNDNYPSISDAEKRKELLQFFMAGPACLLAEMKCLNCRHWRHKAQTSKGWGICDNPQNQVKAGPLAMIRYYLKNDPKAAEELANEVEQGIRYPEDFGCIFFEPTETT